MQVRTPTLARIFDHKPFGYVYKHTVEPYATYRYQTGISNFAAIIRFDYRDILADTNEVEYELINRLYVKRTHSSSKCYNRPHYLPLESVTGAQQWSDKEWAEKRERRLLRRSARSGQRGNLLEDRAKVFLRSDLRRCGCQRGAQRVRHFSRFHRHCLHLWPAAVLALDIAADLPRQQFQHSMGCGLRPRFCSSSTRARFH